MEAPLKNREREALDGARELLADEIGFYRFQQYEFDRQWKKLHAYANENGVKIIGDIPIYVAFDSRTPGRRRSSSSLTRTGNPPAWRVSAGRVSRDGAALGNPLYDWEYHKRPGTSGGSAGSRTASGLYDVVRSIISGDSTNIIRSRTGRRPR